MCGLSVGAGRHVKSKDACLQKLRACKRIMQNRVCVRGEVHLRTTVLVKGDPWARARGS